MNRKYVLSVIGKALLIEACAMLIPFIISIVYGENYMAFVIPIAGLLVLGLPFALLKTNKSIYAKEGFVIVALVWILMSLIGAIPFVYSGTLDSYVDALFETVSGFTTTGASVMSSAQIDNLSMSIGFWRIFTHFMGGMGVLVFVLAIMPNYNAGLMHVFRAESPGPSVSKFVAKLSFTAKILYAIYFTLTITEAVLLMCGGMGVYDSILHAFSTAGTGGFSTFSSSLIEQSTYTQIVVGVFMILFGINFNLFFLILVGGFFKAIKSEEFISYIILLAVSVIAISLNLYFSAEGYEDYSKALLDAFFQTASISSTTGFATADFNTWPALSQAIIILLMIIGACGGSTGGGVKVSRMSILIKSSYSDMKKMLHPRAITSVRYEGQRVDEDTIRNVKTFIVLWILLVIISTIVLSISEVNGNDFLTNLTASFSCMSNVGPGLAQVGPIYSYALYSPFAKIWLSLIMLCGRLEIMPMVFLFLPQIWKKA